MPMIICSDCSKEISDSAPACPSCGRPNINTHAQVRSVGILLWVGIFFIPFIFSWFTLRKGHTTKAKVFSFGWLIFFLIMGAQDGTNTSSGGSFVREAPTPVQSAYPSDSNLDYRAATLEQLEEGTLLTFTGKVLQVIDNDGLRLATKQKEYIGYSGDDVYLSFEDKPQVLDDEIIKVMGRYDGTVKYKTILGSERVVPKIKVDYFTVLETRK